MRARIRTGVARMTMMAVAVAAGCEVARTTETPPAPPAGSLDIATAEIIDLTHAFDAQTIYWPTSPTRFELDTLSWGMTEGGWFYSANQLATPEHGGTHLDAPIHFSETGEDAASVGLDRLIGPAVVIDVSQQSSADADYRLTAADIEAWEAEHGRIEAGSIVLLRTGWSERWPDAASYLGSNVPGDASNLHFPSYSEESARILVEQRNVAVLGADVASIDYGASTDFIVHRVAAAANVPGLENLTNLGSLPARGAWVIALPIKTVGGSGGPLRAVALVPRQ
jgi:kynurenine formamidase